MEPIKVLIIVEGGIVQGITANNPDVRFCVLDFDTDSHEPVMLTYSNSPADTIIKADEMMHEKAFKCKLDRALKYAKTLLKSVNF